MLFAIKIPNPNDPGSSGSGFTPTTHIDESELLAAGAGVNAWGEISSLMPTDNSLFFKWGGEIGTPIELTYSFIGSDFVDYDENYYDVTGSGARDAELEASIQFMRNTSGATPIEFTYDEPLYPKLNTILVELADPLTEFIVVEASPKSCAFPVVAIVI